MARGCIARMGNSGCVGHGEQHAGEILSRTYVTVCVTSWLLAASLVGGILHKRRVCDCTIHGCTNCGCGCECRCGRDSAGVALWMWVHEGDVGVGRQGR
jgi:hypothetical protein